jgi:hypothetical protein
VLPVIVGLLLFSEAAAGADAQRFASTRSSE